MTKKYPKDIKTEVMLLDNTLTSEDECLWALVTSDVMPLKSPGKQLDALKFGKKLEKKLKKPTRSSKKNSSIGELNNKNIPFKHGNAPGLDTRTKLRLRRGQINIESRLDLHGMTQPEAHARLIEFLEKAYTNGLRAVLVITGKGLRPDGKTGILRNIVPHWLGQPTLSHVIKAFGYAVPRDGGEGALYVLLRRRK